MARADLPDLIEHSENHSTYTYSKNRRYPVPAGTRCANVRLAAHQRNDFRSEKAKRLSTMRAAELRAVNLWEQRWGPLPWPLAEFATFHDSLGCIVELRVEPR